MPNQTPHNSLAAPLELRLATIDDAADLAAIRAACFNTPWEAKIFADMLAGPENFCLIVPGAAYLLAQKIPPEAEIITIAVMPAHRRQGIAEHMLRNICMQLIAQDIDTLHLEVSEKLVAAQKLYAKLGFVPVGRRANYYVSSTGEHADAILMRRALPL